MNKHICSVQGCENDATVEVRLYDEYFLEGKTEVFDELDFTCSFLCHAHMTENEEKAIGERRPRGNVRYPFTNQHGGQGYTTYRPLTSTEN